MNLSPSQFNYSSVRMDSDFIFFDFDSSEFSFPAITESLNTIKFQFDKHRFEFDSMFSFKATSIRFYPNSVRFSYDHNSFNFTGANKFKAKANLFDYKFSDSQISTIEEDINFVQLDATDFRALEYSFDGDELFDSDYYLEEYNISSAMNPFTDYVENGDSIGRNPNALFDNAFYNANNPDVASDAETTALRHYLESGWRESLPGSPTYNPEKNTNFNSFFNAEDYFEIHDDVRIESYASDAKSPLEDLMDFGLTEGRIYNKTLQADTLVKSSLVITPDSDPTLISQTKNNLAANGISLEINDDGNFQLASTSVFEETNPFRAVTDFLGDTATAVVGGIIYGIYQSADLVFEAFSEASTVVNIGDFTAGFSGYTYIYSPKNRNIR